MERIFHTPEGFRDIYREELQEKLYLQRQIAGVFDRFGYQEIQTPAVEYFEVFSREVGTIPSRDLYKFFDHEGNTMVLRPDFTPSIARAAASFFLDETDSLRLSYTGNTFVNHSGLMGRMHENTQMGVEYMGDSSAEADGEILALLVEALKSSGLREFQISVGEVDFFKALLREAHIEEETEETLRSLISQKNYFGVEELLRGQQMSKELTDAFLALPHLFGSAEVLTKAREMTANPQALAAISRLEKIYEILKLYGCEKYISFDLGMLSKYRYYTGIIFQGYTYGTGEPIAKGGRYDSLLKHFGKSAPAVGLGILVDQLHLALNRQKAAIPVPEAARILFYGEEDKAEIIAQACALRRQGVSVQLKKRKEEESCAI